MNLTEVTGLKSRKGREPLKAYYALVLQLERHRNLPLQRPAFFNACVQPRLAYHNHQTPAVSTALSPLQPMSSGFFWADACANALGSPLQTLLDALYASCGVTVR